MLRKSILVGPLWHHAVGEWDATSLLAGGGEIPDCPFDLFDNPEGSSALLLLDESGISGPFTMPDTTLAGSGRGTLLGLTIIPR